MKITTNSASRWFGGGKRAVVFLLLCGVLGWGKGFQVTVLRSGEGPQATLGRVVRVHYVGKLADSTVFDDSRTRGEPLEFTLGAAQVIEGWEKGIEGMRVGEVRRLVIPPEMGYGERAVGPIPPGSTLIFEVELLRVEKGLEPDVLPADWQKKPWRAIASGLDVVDEAVGQGVEARPGREVTLHYTGWLTGGTRFGSSKSENKPVKVMLGAGKVIRGWELGLVGLRAGSVRWLRVQPALGYGSTALARIPANSELLFRVEVLQVDADADAEESMDLFPDLDLLQWQDGREGLRFAVVQEGSGAPARPGEKVQVHYTGWTADGEKFDSSRDRNQPFAFPLGAARVIRGWDLGVEGMRPGEKRILWIPPGLGYGSRGAGPIPPDATLIFAVEYLGNVP